MSAFYVIDQEDYQRVNDAIDRGEVEFAYQQVGILFGKSEENRAKLYCEMGGEIKFLIEKTPDKLRIYREYGINE